MLNRIAYRLLHTAKDNPNQGRFSDNGYGGLYLEYPTRELMNIPTANKIKRSSVFVNFFDMLDTFHNLYLNNTDSHIPNGIYGINKYIDELIKYLQQFKSNNNVLLQNFDNWLDSL